MILTAERLLKTHHPIFGFIPEVENDVSFILTKEIWLESADFKEVEVVFSWSNLDVERVGFGRKRFEIALFSADGFPCVAIGGASLLKNQAVFELFTLNKSVANLSSLLKIVLDDYLQVEGELKEFIGKAVQAYEIYLSYSYLDKVLPDVNGELERKRF